MKSLILAITLLLAIVSTVSAGQTWVNIDGVLYGAKPDERGPIGGGVGYTEIVTSGDHIARTLDELIEALEAVQAGEVVFIPGDVEIDMTARIYIDKLALEIAEGVTLASDRGHNGSPGALLTSDALDTPVMIQILGPDVRITGLRLRGPNAKQYLEHHRRSFGGEIVHPPDGIEPPERRAHRYYYQFPTSNGIITNHHRLRVDNCELSAFGHGAIRLNRGEGHLVHHNFIHHCQYHGLGYGISHNTSSSIIEYNLFDVNRHSIAGSGRPGSGYIARHNVELAVATSHCFDMHGGRDRMGDETDIAGTSIEVTNNTFYPDQRAVVIRGVPEEGCLVTRNWFFSHADAEAAVRAEAGTDVIDNLYGEDAIVK